MQIQLNGEPTKLPGPLSVSQLLEHLGRSRGRVAVEVNREIVPASRHPQHMLDEGDVVELVQAMGGGRWDTSSLIARLNRHG